MDATCAIQDSIHVFSLVYKYVSRILGTYHKMVQGLFVTTTSQVQHACMSSYFWAGHNDLFPATVPRLLFLTGINF